ncbi:hypothetical protein HK100_007070, partial [Physocladia obscura]
MTTKKKASYIVVIAVVIIVALTILNLSVQLFARKSSSSLIPSLQSGTSRAVKNPWNPATIVPVHAPAATLGTYRYVSNTEAVFDYAAAVEGCPTPQNALIGILTIPTAKATARRMILRETYRRLNNALIPTQKLDIKFVFGQPVAGQDSEDAKAIAAEKLLFSEDMVVLDTWENMDEGKTYNWFKYARKELLYTVHPIDSKKLCPRYRAIGKSDDDTLIHITRLSKELGKLDPYALNFIGRWTDNEFMTGMLHFLSPPLVEYVSTSNSIAKKISGYADRCTLKWLLDSKLEWNIVSYRENFIAFVDIPGWFAGFMTENTLCLHGTKDSTTLYRAMLELYNSDG